MKIELDVFNEKDVQDLIRAYLSYNNIDANNVQIQVEGKGIITLDIK